MIPMASTFVEAAEGLNNSESGQVFRFLSKFHQNPSHPSLSLERLTNSKSPNIWSARVSSDYRAILCQQGANQQGSNQPGSNWIAVYVDHHDEAYRWAETHQVGQHPVTGQWQIVEMPVVREGEKKSARLRAAKPIFEKHSDQYLLSLGLPEEWLLVVRQVRTEAELNDLVNRMPEDVGLRLLDLAEGKPVLPPAPLQPNAPLAEIEATTSQLVIVQSERQLQSILREPLAKWMAFLHPSQKKLVNFESKGATKVTGSAGTGKTVVAMHRARHFASQGRRVLVTSFTQTICKNIERNLRLLCTKEEMFNIAVINVHKLAQAVLRETKDRWNPVTDDQVAEMIAAIHPGEACPLDAAQLLVEFLTIIDPQAITSWDEYRGASRAGRGRALSVRERKEVWAVIEQLRQRLERKRQTTWQGICREAAAHLPPLTAKRAPWRYDAVIVDEVQDLKPQELHFLARLAPVKNLFLAGDAGQQIYPGRVSLNSIGIDVRGRSSILRINYRTTEQIRKFADKLLAEEFDDLDGGVESRGRTRSVLRGLDPILTGFQTRAEQFKFVLAEIRRLIDNAGYSLEDIAVFARQSNNLDGLETRLRQAKFPYFEINKEDVPPQPSINIGTMHRAKGLEFKVVFVIDLHDGNVPHLKTVEAGADEVVRAARLAGERQLLYVSVTRARDLAYLVWAGEPSRFLSES